MPEYAYRAVTANGSAIRVPLAMASGISPTTLAPAQSEVTLEIGSQSKRIHACSDFSDFGESIEIRWG
jgi:hypothetical protein